MCCLFFLVPSQSHRVNCGFVLLLGWCCGRVKRAINRNNKMSEKKNSIENKLSEISKRALIFSDRERLKKGGIYIPDIFLNFVKISEIASVIKGVKPVLEFNCSCEYKYKMEQGLKELKNIYGLEYCVSSRKFLINSPKDHSEVVDINDPRRGMI